MNYLLDTNHWSFLQRRHESVIQRIRSLPVDVTLYMPVVAQAELLAGIEIVPPGKRREELRRLYEETLAQATEILPIDSNVAGHFARVFGGLRAAGRPIGTNDIWIAAIALAHDLTLVTSDPDFRNVSNLRLEDWSVVDPSHKA